VTVNAPPAGPTIRVRSVTVSVSERGRDWEGNASVTVEDETGSRVTEATVSGDWNLNGRIFNSGASGTTDGQGRARISSGKFQASSGDLLTFTVTHVSKTGATWDGQQKSASATVQDD
jgi:hypothetical protein